MEKGEEISVELERIYSFAIDQIIEGSSKLDSTKLGEAIKVLDILHSAWAEIAQKEDRESVPTELLVQQAAEGRLALHG